MKLLELFAGTRSVGKVFEKRGHKVFSVEWNKDFENIDLCYKNEVATLKHLAWRPCFIKPVAEQKTIV